MSVTHPSTPSNVRHEMTVRCSSSVWAHELSLLGPQIVARLDGALGAEGPSAVRSLRFVTGTSEPR